MAWMSRDVCLYTSELQGDFQELTFNRTEVEIHNQENTVFEQSLNATLQVARAKYNCEDHIHPNCDAWNIKHT